MDTGWVFLARPSQENVLKRALVKLPALKIQLISHAHHGDKRPCGPLLSPLESGETTFGVLSPHSIPFLPSFRKFPKKSTKNFFMLDIRGEVPYNERDIGQEQSVNA